MALVPRMLRPSVLLRRKAMYSGFLGNSTFWKVIGIFVFGRSSLKKFFGKNVEVIDVSSLGTERFMDITTAKPMTRRRRRRLTRAGQAPPTLAEQRSLATWWADSAVAEKAAKARK